jgi:predicted DNA-binding protein (UPF0278 family)
LELSKNLIWFDEISPWFSLKINGIGYEIYNRNCNGQIISYMGISIDREEMELVAKEEDVNDHISNNVNVTEIKWDPLGDNLQVPYEIFYKFINNRLTYLFYKNAFLNDAVKEANIYIENLKNKVK